jgi:hypothetical protein
MSIQKGVFNGVAVYKVIHKNSIGKILYDSSISGTHSKLRAVPEKSHKNQMKVALVRMADGKPMMQYCLINFQRADDLQEF